VLALHARPNRDVFVGGEFSAIGGMTRGALALMTVAAAPVLIQDTATDVFLTRNPSDGSEITHFQITATNNGTLYLSDGVTPVNVGDF
jgi:hypothetical protein